MMAQKVNAYLDKVAKGQDNGHVTDVGIHLRPLGREVDLLRRRLGLGRGLNRLIEASLASASRHLAAVLAVGVAFAILVQWLQG